MNSLLVRSARLRQFAWCWRRRCFDETGAIRSVQVAPFFLLFFHFLGQCDIGALLLVSPSLGHCEGPFPISSLVVVVHRNHLLNLLASALHQNHHPSFRSITLSARSENCMRRRQLLLVAHQWLCLSPCFPTTILPCVSDSKKWKTHGSLHR